MTPDPQLIDKIVELGGKIFPQKGAQEGDPFVLVPNGMKVESLEHLCPPRRIQRCVKLFEADSFCEYVNRFKVPNTLIFACSSESGVLFTGMLAYHSPAPELKPSMCAHMATFGTVQTPDWKAWCAANRKPMSQVEFATWLEDNAPLFTEPTGAQLLELVQTLVGSSDVRFNSAVRLQSGGNRLQYDEDVVLRGQSTTTSGDIELPAVLKAGIAPFEGSPKYELSARLKYRIDGRKLALWFETIRMHVIVRDSVMLIVQQVAEKTGIKPLFGSP